MATETELNEYVVVADAVTLNTGRERKPGEAEVIRLVNGETIYSPPNNGSVIELLAMGGIVLKSEAKATYKSLMGLHGDDRHRPMAARNEGDKAYRITASGVSYVMLGSEDPEEVVDGAVPQSAENPDLSVPEASAAV